jgi:hypothetical protein
MDKQKKIWLVSGLGLLWVGVALWQWGTLKEPVREPLTNVSGAASVGKPGKEGAATLRVNLELLASARAQREATFTAPRNIFAVPRQDGTLTVAQDGGVAPQRVQNSALDPLLAQPAVESSPYRYLGFLRMGEGRTKAKDVAVLSKDEEVMVVKVGDHVEDRLVLKKITPDSVTIMDTAARMEHTVPLSEESPVQP